MQKNKILSLFDNLFTFDLFSISIRISEKHIKHICFSMNHIYNLITDTKSEILFFKHSICQKVLDAKNPIINYIHEKKYAENNLFQELNLKYAIHFPVAQMQELEASLNFAYYSIHQTLNILDLDQKVKSKIPELLYYLKDSQFENLLSKLGKLSFNYFFEKKKKAHFHKNIIQKILNNDFSFNIKKKKILIEKKKNNNIVFISSSLEGILNIKIQDKFLEDFIPSYQKIAFRIYQHSFLNHHYIPLSLVIDKYIHKFLVKKLNLKSKTLDDFQIYEFFLEKDLKALNNNNLLNNKENDTVNFYEKKLEENINSQSELDQELNEIRTSNQQKLVDMDQWMNQKKENINTLLSAKDLQKNIIIPKKLIKKPKYKIKKGNNQKILIIEPEKEFSFLIAQFLHQIQYRIQIAHNTEEAFKHFEAQNPDLIILDISIENFNGFLFIYSIYQKLNYIPAFIVLTKKTHIEILKKSYQLGALSFLNKKEITLDQISIFIFEALQYYSNRKKRSFPKNFDIHLDKFKDFSFYYKEKNPNVYSENTPFSQQKLQNLNLNLQSQNPYKIDERKKNENLEALGFNLEEVQESITWKDNQENQLKFSGYFLDKKIFNFTIKGIFTRQYSKAIIEYLEDAFLKDSKNIARHIHLILDLNQISFYGIEFNFFIKLISRIIKIYKIQNFLYITSNQDIIRNIKYYHQKKVTPHYEISKNIVNALNYLISNQII